MVVDKLSDNLRDGWSTGSAMRGLPIGQILQACSLLSPRTPIEEDHRLTGATWAAAAT